MAKEIKCKTCPHCEFWLGNGDPNRYYCSHPERPNKDQAGAKLICRTLRHSPEYTIKLTPRWCPEKGPQNGK
jgi:hypothetical protein